jgi:Holliday junction DNA helicase RuvA
VIASVEGRVSALTADGVVVVVGGVGLAVHTTAGTRARLRVGEQALLATSLVVREDSLTLYGFADDDERALFELLQTASGVGPRLAQAGAHRAHPRRRAARAGHRGPRGPVPGAGRRRKGAQRMVLELKDKAAGGVGGGAPETGAQPSGWRDTLSARWSASAGPPRSPTRWSPGWRRTTPAAGNAGRAGLLREALALLGRAR